MELTQERLDDLVQKGLDAENALGSHWAPFAEWNETLTFPAKDKRRASTKAIIEEATGEKVTIVELEPEIPEAVSTAAIRAFFAGGYHHISRALIVEVLQAAYKAGWGGLRK